VTARMAIVGDATSVAGFRSLGFAAFAIEDPAEARDLMPRLTGGEYGIVFVTEAVYAATEDLVRELADQPVPAFTVIPGAGSPGGVGQAKLDRAIERALGTSVPFTEEKDE
jgi:V/A-type H+-transporting ATPase subunit F